MFKIIENKDGTKTVFCSESGRMICSVSKMRDKPLGIGRPIPRAAAPFSQDQTKGASTSTKSTDKSAGVNKLFAQIVPMICPLLNSEGIITEKCSFEVDVDPYIDAEINKESLVQKDFLQMLGLVPEKKLENEEWKKLREDLPTRFISRTSSKDVFRISSDRKIYEECDFASPMGLKFLNETPEGQKNALDSNIIDACVKKYNHYCRIANAGAFVNGPTAHYSMRDREIKLFPITYKTKSHQEYSHKYCFNAHQRQEQKIRIKTGLNIRSRKLKALCRNRGKIYVKAIRLRDKEIKEWTRRRPPPPPEVIVIDDDSDIEIDVYNASKVSNQQKMSVLLKSCNSKPNSASPTSAQRVLVSQSSKSLSHMRKPGFSQMHTIKTGNCYVKLQNVLEQLEAKPDGTYCMKNTKIKISRIPAVTKLEAVLSQLKKCGTSVHPYARPHREISLSATSRHYDHPYYQRKYQAPAKEHLFNGTSRPRQQYVNGCVLTAAQPKPIRSATDKTHLQFQSSINNGIFPANHPNSSRNLINCHQLPSTPSQAKIIPLVDLASEDETKDTHVTSPSELRQPSRTDTAAFPCSLSVFHCYACGNYKKTFRRKDDASRAARQHLVSFHTVLQPEMFLETSRDSSNQYTLVEAFPGYKSS